MTAWEALFLGMVQGLTGVPSCQQFRPPRAFSEALRD
jgi:hypothetical protein